MEADCVRTVRSDEAVVNVDAVDLNAIEVAGHGLVAVEGTDLNAVEDAAEGASHDLVGTDLNAVEVARQTGLVAVEGTDLNVVEESVEVAGHGLVAVEGTDLNAVEDAAEGAGHGLVAVEGTDLNAVEDAVEDASHGLGMDAAGIENQMKEHIGQLQVRLQAANARIMSLEDKLAFLEPFTEKNFHDDKRTLFYTGLPNYDLLKAVFQFVAPSNNVRLGVL